MGEILVLIIMMGMYATGYISGKAIYKDETNDLNRRLASVRKWWQDGIEESKCLKVFKIKIKNTIEGPGTVQQKYNKIKDLVQECESEN